MSKLSHQTTFTSGDGTRQDISPGLCEIDGFEPLQQAAFWGSCVKGKQPELEQLGGLPLDSIVNGVLTRYFDSSVGGINQVYDSSLRDQTSDESTELNKDGLYMALSEHLMFFQVFADEEVASKVAEGTDEAFERVCKATGLPCSRQSFAYAVRRLRIALLIKQFGLSTRKSDGKIFHVDYDDHFIHSELTTSDQSKKVHNGRSDHQTYNVPVVPEQKSVSIVAQFLFTAKQLRGGRVHWTHLQNPGTELVLAVGQVLRLPGSHLGMICDLEKAQPQMCAHDPDDLCLEDDGLQWSNLVMPSVYLDHASQENLDLYRRWFARMQDPRLRDTVADEPPPVHIASVHKTLGLMWSSKAANTAITVETDAQYIGKWTTDSKHHKSSLLQGFLDAMTCAGCCKRKKPKYHGGDSKGDYEKVPSQDPDEEHGITDDLGACQTCGKTHLKSGLVIPHTLWEALRTSEGEDKGAKGAMMGQKASEKHVSCIGFEQTFECTIQGLLQRNSVLRVGDHYVLITRIILNQTIHYLDVLELYGAGIARLRHVVQDPQTSNKDDLISKIETIKIELNALDRLVRPFGEFVVPELRTLGEALRPKYPLVFHYIRDVQNNMRMFLPKCDALIHQCEMLTTEYDRANDAKMNNILNILTFITFVITPMQLMTGIYGMNFDVMPELHHARAYTHYFWATALSFTMLFAFILVCLKRP